MEDRWAIPKPPVLLAVGGHPWFWQGRKEIANVALEVVTNGFERIQGHVLDSLFDAVQGCV
jgi:hypothetical protein